MLAVRSAWPLAAAIWAACSILVPACDDDAGKSAGDGGDARDGGGGGGAADGRDGLAADAAGDLGDGGLEMRPDVIVPGDGPPSIDGAADGAEAEADAPVDQPDTAIVSPPDAPPDQPAMPPPPPPPPLPTPAVVISEIMYHPVREHSLVDRYEFLEVHNRASVAMDVSGWRLGGEVTFTFPPGTSIPAGGYTVIARDRAALLAIGSYALAATDIVGEYGGQLDNGGGTVTLIDAAGAVADSVKYGDSAPWPVGADALGADEAWLPPPLLPLASHQHRGRSLERYAFDRTGNDPANWEASPLDAPTPARRNSTVGIPPAIVLDQSARGPGGAIIRSSDQVTVRAVFSAGSIRDVAVEYFVDSLDRSDEPRATVALASAGSMTFTGLLPAARDNSIVRYRIVGVREGGPEVISPRPTDPYAWHAYFVTPVVNTTAPIYAIFVARGDWTRLWDNINFPTEARRVDGCRLRDSWDDRVPAVFVHAGQVHDVRLRYQGSRQHRPDGRVIDTGRTTIDPLPDRPSPLRALGMNLKFPAYANFQKRDTVVLNKLTQSCPGLDAALAQHLYGDPRVNVPVSAVRFARVHVNGGYYHYMMDIEHPDSDMMGRWEPPGTPVGDLFKAGGVRAPDGGPDVTHDEGPFGWGDLRPLAPNPQCPGVSVAERYAATYQRETYAWADHAVLIKLIDDLNAARAALPDVAPLRGFFAQNFDLAKLTDYIAIRNWSEPWDDNFQNYELYRRQDGKWLLVPWDLDLEFGEWARWDASRSFFVGEQGDSDNNRPSGYSTGLWNRLKDAFIKSHRGELVARLKQLDAGVLSPQNVKARIDAAAAGFSEADASASPAGFACSFNSEVGNLRRFADDRHTQLLQLR